MFYVTREPFANIRPVRRCRRLNAGYEEHMAKYWRKPLDLGTIEVSRGTVKVIEGRCKGCEFCVNYCSRGVLRMSKNFNKKGYHFPETISGTDCVNCRFCEVICPEFAIYSVEVPGRV